MKTMEIACVSEEICRIARTRKRRIIERIHSRLAMLTVKVISCPGV